jgi:hypothetical protein
MYAVRQHLKHYLLLVLIVRKALCKYVGTIKYHLKIETQIQVIYNH